MSKDKFNSNKDNIEKLGHFSISEQSSAAIISDKLKNLIIRVDTLLDNAEDKLDPIIIRPGGGPGLVESDKVHRIRLYSPLFEYYITELDKIEEKLSLLEKMINSIDL